MNRILVLISVIAFCSQAGFSQDVKAIKMCKPYQDSTITEIKIENVIKWSESKPLRVGCDDGKVYILHRFDISVFTLNPLQTREYGTGEEGGIPILARNAIMKAGKGDTVILKNAVYLDEQKQEHKLPVISFKLN